MRRLLKLALMTPVFFLMLSASGLTQTQVEEGSPPPLPPAREIPGLTTEDAFPNGCVDCHINRPDWNMDVRLSTEMKQWTDKVEPALLETVQSTMRLGVTLKGKHPPADRALDDVPARCLKCHRANSKRTPPFGRMVHKIHLVGGEKNAYLALFQGECTHCHKLDVVTGTWSLPSGSEK